MHSARPFRIIPVIFCLLVSSWMAAQAGDAQRHKTWPKHKHHATRFDLSKGPKYVPGQVLVRFRSGTSKIVRDQLNSALGTKEIKTFFVADQLQLVKLPTQASVEESIAAYKQDPNVLYAEPNYIVRAHGVPNDPRFSELWGLNNTGQNRGAPDADIDAPEAWSITTGSSNIVIAIIDSGIDYTHPDLAANIFRNSADCNANGVDDDGNGYVDDCYGIDTVNRDSDPMDDFSHGTHVAGTIGALGNNSLGVVGMNWNVQLLPCKFLGADGSGDTAGAIACLDYIAKMKDRGVNIVATNNSWGGEFYSQALEDAFRAQLQRGILAIASAGNEFKDNDVVPSYPASFYLPNIIAVAATDRNDDLVSFSNIGLRSVHLGAPGREILSTIPGGNYAAYSGTSMSAPHVSGVVGLLYAQDSTRDWRTVKNLLLAGGDDIPSFTATVTGKRLNAFGALTCAQSIVTSRLRPLEDAVAATVNSPVRLSVLNINCGSPNGAVQVGVQPGGTSISLTDDGLGFDQSAGDGIYSAEWIPPAGGSFLLSFPDGSELTVVVLENYTADQTASTYRNIAGTSLDLSDDSVALLNSPFAIPFGNGSFTDLYVSSNGTISFTNPVAALDNIPVPAPSPPYVTLVAPFWDDLFPVRGTNQNVFWEVRGNAPARELVVEWRDVRAYECEGDPNVTVKFQVVFHENSPDMLFNYADATFGGACSRHDRGGSANIGIQVAPGVGFAWNNAQGYYGGNFEDVNDGISLLWQLAGTQTPPPNPVPTLSSISPSIATFNGPSFQLTVTGTNFLPSSHVRWNGNDRITTFVSATQLEALISAADLYFPWTNSPYIEVFNPLPGGGLSNQLHFTINNPVPVISELTPDRAYAGGLSFRLKVEGSGFQPNSTVRWNGQDLQTVFYSTTEIVGLIPLDRIANVGTAQVTVYTVPPGGGLSNAIPFTIDPRPAPLSGTPVQAAVSPFGATNPSDTSERIQPPKRFYGWNIARSKGIDYLNHFVRLPARNALPVKNPTPQELAQYQASAAVQTQTGVSSIPGFLLRPSLPAGFIPTSLAAGDFDRDGNADWVVSNGGSNTLWLYHGRGDGTSDPPTILKVSGVTPEWVVAADLRGNGILDIIVAEADSGTIGVLLGKGDGSFNPEVNYYLPAIPIFLLVDDFDGDQHPDILAGLVSNGQYGPVLLLPGKGDGSFGPLRYHPAESSAPFFFDFFTTWISAADANKDGLKDIIITDFGTASGSVAYENRGDGTFKFKQQVSVNDDFVGVFDLSNAMADLNGDGCPEALTLNTFGIAVVYTGKCDGTVDNSSLRIVQPLGLGDVGYGIALADVNGDSLPDLIASGITLGVHPIWGQEAGNLLSVMLNDGHGGFGRARVFRGGTTAYALAVADLNGDGKPDVLTSNQDSDSVSIFLNDGSGGFSMPEGKHVGWHATGVHEGVININVPKALFSDINGDGNADLLLIENGYLYPEPRPITVLLNDGTGKFSDPIRSPGIDATFDVGDFLVGDFRGTGHLDFLAVGQQFNYSQPYISFAPSLGNGQFGPPVVTKPPGALGVVAAADFNGDGKLDFVAASTGSTQPGNTQTLSIFLGNGDGTFTPKGAIPFGGTTYRWPLSIFTGDFNRDTRADILVWLFTNSGPDSDFAVYEFFGNGDGTFGPPQIAIDGSGPIVLADVNKDGWPDIIEAKFPRPNFPTPAPPEFKIRLGQSDGTFSFVHTYTPFVGDHFIPNYEKPIVGDFDGDGNIDVAVFQWPRQSPQHIFLQVLTGNGDGSFVPSFARTYFDKAWPPQFAADMNGDGRADLIELDGYTSSVHVIPAVAGKSLDVGLVSDPVLGANGNLRISIDRPSVGGTTVLLSASDPAISLPASATLPSGAIFEDVPFQIGSAFDNSHVFSIRAQLGSESAIVYGRQADLTSFLGFRIFASYLTQNVQPPQTSVSSDYLLGAFSIEGYATSVTFQCNGLPAGLTCIFGQNPVSVLAGGGTNESLVISAAALVAPGTYPFTVDATDGARNDQVQLSVTVIGQPDFSMEIFPASMTIGSTGSVSFNVSVSPLNNFSGIVAVTCTGLPSGATCAPYGGQPSVIDYTTSWAKVFVVQTQSSAARDFTVSFTGTGNSIARAVSASLHVVDFNVTPPANNSATLSVGGSAKFSFSLASQNGFSDTVTFGCVNPPAGIVCTFNPLSGTLTPGGSLTTELMVVVNSRPSSSVTLPGIPDVPLALRLLIAAILTCIVLVTFRLSRGTWHLQPALRLAASIFLIVCLAGLASCGGGGGGGGGSGTPNPPPPQPVTVTLTVQTNSSILIKNIGTVRITVQ